MNALKTLLLFCFVFLTAAASAQVNTNVQGASRASAQENNHDCLKSLSKKFQAIAMNAMNEKNIHLYVGAWPAVNGLCQALMVKGEVVGNKVSVVYAYGPTTARPAGEVNLEAVVAGKEMTMTLPWSASLKYVLGDSKAFYIDRTGTYEGYISLRTPS